MEDLKQIQEFFSKPLEESKYPSSQYEWDTEHPYSFTIYLPDGDKHHTDFYDLESARQMKKVLDADREVYRMMKSPDGQFNDDIRSLEEDINDFSPMSYAKKVASGNMSIEDAMEETGFPYTKLVAMVKQLNPNFKMQFQENKAQFTDYSNNELAAYAKELSKQRADAASKGQNDLVSGINKEIEAAVKELKKRSQKLKDLSRTDVNEAFGEQYYLRVRLKDSPEAMKAFDDFIGKNDFRINKGGDQFSTDDVKAGIKLYRHLTDRLVKVYDHNLPLEDKNLPVYEAKEEDKIDIVVMDVPLFIRVLEYAREDAQADMDLHDLAEKAISATKQQGLLQMDDYDMLVGEKESVDEEEGYSKFLKDDPEHPGGKTKGLTPDVMNKILMNVIKNLDESRPGLWDNIRAKKERGEKPSPKNSKAYKAAVKAGKEINKTKK